MLIQEKQALLLKWAVHFYINKKLFIVDNCI